MSSVNFRTLDLNLLRVFDALIEERNVTRAGERLGVTQSAVSHGLNRLRHALDDELFLRGPDGMSPTQRALDIAPQLREGLLRLQQALTVAEFDPARTQRLFTIGGTSYFRTVLIPPVVARLRAEAPLADIRIHPGDVGVVEDLDGGRLDLVFGGFGRLPERFESERLFDEELLWVLAANHPLADGALTVERLAALPHVVIDPTVEGMQLVAGAILQSGLERPVISEDEGALLAALAQRGLSRRIGMRVPDANTALLIVGQSDMTALAPRRLAARWAELGRLKLFAPPYPSTPSRLSMLWHRVHGAYPAVAWLRRIVREVAAGL